MACTWALFGIFTWKDNTKQRHRASSGICGSDVKLKVSHPSHRNCPTLHTPRGHCSPCQAWPISLDLPSLSERVDAEDCSPISSVPCSWLSFVCEKQLKATSSFYGFCLGALNLSSLFYFCVISQSLFLQWILSTCEVFINKREAPVLCAPDFTYPWKHSI